MRSRASLCSMYHHYHGQIAIAIVTTRNRPGLGLAANNLDVKTLPQHGLRVSNGEIDIVDRRIKNKARGYPGYDLVLGLQVG